MKLQRLKRSISLLLILATSLLFNSCSTVRPSVAVHVEIPARPELAQCPEKPEISGKIVEMEGVGKVVMLEYADAHKLANFISETMICGSLNEEILKAHVEKLENRLKALGR